MNTISCYHGYQVSLVTKFLFAEPLPRVGMVSDVLLGLPNRGREGEGVTCDGPGGVVVKNLLHVASHT